MSCSVPTPAPISAVLNAAEGAPLERDEEDEADVETQGQKDKERPLLMVKPHPGLSPSQRPEQEWM